MRIWKRFLRRWLGLLKGFGNFLLKELKELMRDPKILLGMIIIPVIMFPVLGAVINFSMQSAQESAAKTVVLVLNHDAGKNSTEFIAYLNSSVRAVDVSMNVSTRTSFLRFFFIVKLP